MNPLVPPSQRAAYPTPASPPPLQERITAPAAPIPPNDAIVPTPELVAGSLDGTAPEESNHAPQPQTSSEDCLALEDLINLEECC